MHYKQAKNVAIKQQKMEENKSGDKKLIDNDIGSAAKTLSPRLPTVANRSNMNGLNVKPTKDLNV